MLQIYNKELGNIIYNRLNGIVPRIAIHDSISIICEGMTKKLQNNEPIVVDNFGMLDVSVFRGHKGSHINTGDIFFINSFKRVSFIPNKIFSDFLYEVRNKFKKEDK